MQLNFDSIGEFEEMARAMGYTKGAVAVAEKQLPAVKATPKKKTAPKETKVEAPKETAPKNVEEAPVEEAPVVENKLDLGSLTEYIQQHWASNTARVGEVRTELVGAATKLSELTDEQRFDLMERLKAEKGE